MANFFSFFFSTNKFFFLPNKQAADCFLLCCSFLLFFSTVDISAASGCKYPSSSTSEPAWFTQEPSHLSVHGAQEAPQPLHPNSVPGRCRKWIPKQCLYVSHRILLYHNFPRAVGDIIVRIGYSARLHMFYLHFYILHLTNELGLMKTLHISILASV